MGCVDAVTLDGRKTGMEKGLQPNPVTGCEAVGNSWGCVCLCCELYRASGSDSNTSPLRLAHAFCALLSVNLAVSQAQRADRRVSVCCPSPGVLINKTPCSALALEQRPRCACTQAVGRSC